MADPQVVRRWETGKMVPRLNTAAAIANALGVSLDALVNGDGIVANPASIGSRAGVLIDELPEHQAKAVLLLTRNLVDGLPNSS